MKHLKFTIIKTETRVRTSLGTATVLVPDNVTNDEAGNFLLELLEDGAHASFKPIKDSETEWEDKEDIFSLNYDIDPFQLPNS